MKAIACDYDGVVPMDTEGMTQEAVLRLADRGLVWTTAFEVSNGVRVRGDVIAGSKELAQEIITLRGMSEVIVGPWTSTNQN